MKCNVCGQEFGDGAYCQNCNADRITASGNYSGGYNAPAVSQEKSGAGSSKAVGSTQKTGADSGSSDSGKSESIGRETLDNKRTAAKNEDKYIVCYSCANVVPADSEFCPCCGTKLFVICPKCGHKYSSQYMICNKCGTNRDEYLEEQRLQERRRQEEEREKEKERKRQLEEQQKLEQQRREEERRRREAERERQLEEQRRLEQRRKEEAQRLEAERKRQEEEQRIKAEREKALKDRIRQSESFKEALRFITRKSKMEDIKLVAFLLLFLCIGVLLMVLSLATSNIILFLMTPIFIYGIVNYLFRNIKIKGDNDIANHNFGSEFTRQIVASYLKRYGYGTDSIEIKLVDIIYGSMNPDNQGGDTSQNK